MAKVFGEPSRNAAEQSFKHTKRLLIAALCSIGGLGVLGGYAFGARFPFKELSLPLVLLINALLWALMWLIGKWGTDKIDAIDRQRLSWRKGAVGEALVAGILEALPDEFVVVNDVSKRFGNLDHIVIGPTGVYVIDAKNWRGTVSAKGDGELLINGKPPGKPAIRMTLGAVMDFQGKLKALTEKDYFVRGLLVFPMAFVDANFGSTRQIHCLRDDRVIDYIQKQTFSTKLEPDDIKRIKRATLQLAQMDERFENAGR
jgi:hypothetical protein